MTRLLEKAVEVARQLSPEEQDELARAMLLLVGADDGEPVILTDEERAAIARSRAAAERGEIASEGQLEAVLKKYKKYAG